MHMRVPRVTRVQVRICTILAFEKSAVECIEDRENHNRNCEVGETSERVAYPRNRKECDDFFEEHQDYSVYHEHKKPESEDNKWKSKDF